MNTSLEAASLAGVLDRKLRLLREFAGDLIACRTAYVSMDLEAIYSHVATQTALCDQLRQLESERRVAWHAACSSFGLDPQSTDVLGLIARLEPPAAAPLREIVTALALAEGELRHLNRVHTVLVQGSRRTLGLLAHVLGSFAPTYSRPSTIDSAAPVPLGTRP